MRSFVLWYIPRKEENDNSKIKLHINLWKVKKCFSKEKFIFDFGFFIDDITKIKEIYFYVPFKIEEFKDLGAKVLNNHKLVGAIFNEVCDIESVRAGKRIKVKMGKDKNVQFMFYSLGEDQVIREECHDNHGGYIVIFKLENILNNNEKNLNEENISEIKNYYFRFRLKTDKKNLKFIKNQDFDQSIFSNAFTRTEIIDFRINDIRTCSEVIKEKFRNNLRFYIEKINYLLLRNFNDEFIYYDGNVKSRILENDLWDDYIEEVHEDLIAYHIKESVNKGENKKIDSEKIDEGIGSFVNLTRFKYKNSNYLMILTYFLILIISGILTGLTASIILEHVENYKNFKQVIFISIFSYPVIVYLILKSFELFFKKIKDLKNYIIKRLRNYIIKKLKNIYKIIK